MKPIVVKKNSVYEVYTLQQLRRMVSDYKTKHDVVNYSKISKPKLIDLLDDSRADDNKEWFEVSCIINNELSHDADNALKVFENFCKRSDKFIKGKDIKWFKSLSIRKDGLKLVL